MPARQSNGSAFGVSGQNRGIPRSAPAWEDCVVRQIELLASYWTIAGDRYPGGPTEVSPFSLRERCEAASAAGYTGLGLVI